MTINSVKNDTDLIRRLRDRGPEVDRAGWIGEENIEMIKDAGILRNGVPARFSGLERPIGEQVDALRELGRGCGSTAWVSMVWMSNSGLLSLYPDKALDDVYASTPDVKISGGFTPSGELLAVDGGYRLSGTWRFNTGCKGADWNMAAASRVQADGTQDEAIALVPMSEFEIADDWDVFGARGTGSASTSASDVFVPEHRVVSFEHALSDTTPDRHHIRSDRAYGLFPLVITECAAVCLGIAEGALDLLLKKMASGRAITYTKWEDQREFPVTQINVAHVHNMLSAAAALLHEEIVLLQHTVDAGEQLSMEERAELRGRCAYIIELSRNAVEKIYRESGASVLNHSQPIQRFYRDIMGFSQHALLNFATNMEVHGRVLQGLDPESFYL